MSLAFFLQGAALGLTAAASPGPFQTFLISQSLAGGFRRGSPAALAPLITDGPIVALILLTLNQLPPVFLRVLSLGGGLFALYLAWGLWRQWRAGAGPEAGNEAGAGNSLWRGVIANFLSPGPYLFWSLVNGPLLISAWNESPWSAATFLVGFYGVFVCGLLVIAALFAQTRRLGPKTVRALLLVSAAVLVGFAGMLVRGSIVGM